MEPHAHPVFRFGTFTLVPSERLLLRDGAAISMTGRAFDLLVELVRNAGHLVTKEELLARVWPGVVVEEVNLSVNVSALRKVAALDPEGAEWIETVPRQGYRFNAPVEVADVATVNLAELRGWPASYRNEPSGTPSPRPRRRRPLAALAATIVVVAIGLLGAWRLSVPSTPFASVAVLPFSADSAANAYLADGLAEAMIHGLTPVHALRVIPRASAFRFKAPAPSDPIDAGRKLGAEAVLTGALSSQAGKVMLRVELVDVGRNAQAWSAAYEVAGAELPRLEAQVMRDVVSALRLKPAGAAGAVLARLPTANPDAYRAYLEGRFFWNQRSEQGLKNAVEKFERAIALDPEFALAHAGLADAHSARGYLGHLAPVATFPVARPHALRALELDPSLAQAHAALAYIKFYFDWDWAGAQEEFRKALALNPADPTAHQWYAVYLLAAGRSDEAFREVQAAHRLDPLSLAINTDIGFHHYYNGRYPEAVAQLKSVLAMKDDFLLAQLWLARTYLAMGRHDEALAIGAVGEGRVREWPVLVAARGFTYGTAGKVAEARSVVGEMQALSKRRFVTAYGTALVHAGLGQKDEAFGWLEKAFEERSHWLVWLRLDPRWNTLRGDPRFDQMVARMKYPA